MKILERANLVIGIITGVPIIFGIIAGATGWFRNLQYDTRLLFVAILLLVVLLLLSL